MKIFIGALMGLSLTVSVAVADQSDPRLDRLFDQLQQTENPNHARLLQHQIWVIWFSHESPKVQRAMGEGSMAMAKARHKEALAAFSRAVKLDDEYAEAWNRRATTHYLLGHYEKALGDLKRVLELEPRHFGALSGRGLVLRDQGRLRKAIQSFREALDVNPHMQTLRLEIHRLKSLLKQAI